MKHVKHVSYHFTLTMFQLCQLKTIPVQRSKESTLISTKTHRKKSKNKSQFSISLEKFPMFPAETELIFAMMTAVTTPWTPVTPGGSGSHLWWPGGSLRLRLRGHEMTSISSKHPRQPQDWCPSQSGHFRRNRAVVSRYKWKVMW